MAKRKDPPDNTKQPIEAKTPIYPPFQGGSYQEFKIWPFRAQEALAAHRRAQGEMPTNVVELGIPDVDEIKWGALNEEDAQAFAREAIDSCDAEALFNMSWDFGTPFHNGSAIVYKIGTHYFADMEEGLFGPYELLEELLTETELNKPRGEGTTYKSGVYSSEGLAALLSAEYMDVGEEILINNETWVANERQLLVRSSDGTKLK